MNIIFIVSVIESARVLNTEFFSASPETIAKDEVRDLEIAFFSARLVPNVRVSLKPLSSELCSVRLDTRFPMLAVGFLV